MRHNPLDATQFRELVDSEENANVERIHYCYQIGSTFVNLALMEDTIINAMTMCDRIKVATILGSDTVAWELLKKRDQFQSSTLGNLIGILSKHGILEADLAYLKWVKAKRDFFVHRFFHNGGWPGDLHPEEIRMQCRTLLYLEAIFIRAAHRIWKIFGRANLMEYVDLGPNGALMLPVDFAEKF